jgi:hypothetical protein
MVQLADKKSGHRGPPYWVLATGYSFLYLILSPLIYERVEA